MSFIDGVREETLAFFQESSLEQFDVELDFLTEEYVLETIRIAVPTRSSDFDEVPPDQLPQQLRDRGIGATLTYGFNIFGTSTLIYYQLATPNPWRCWGWRGSVRRQGTSVGNLYVRCPNGGQFIHSIWSS